MKRNVTLLLELVCLSCFANPIDVNMARKNATKFFAKHNRVAETRSASEKTESMQLVYSRVSEDVDHPLFYVFNLPSENGYIIMAGDDCIDDVLGYTDKGSFDEGRIPGGVNWLLEKYEQQMRYAISKGMNRRVAKADRHSNIAPLLTSTWNQGTPYNDLCPKGSDGKKCPTGCIATAMAQILYYHKWPIQGIRSHSYLCDVNRNQKSVVELSADFGNTTYDWGAMIDSYKKGNESEEARRAVATLMYHCGVSLDMVYKDEGSSPTNVKEAIALKKYFRYSADVKNLLNVNDEDFTSTVYEELSQKRPVFVCGGSKDGKNGAHAFVCDGYQEGGYFHFNWGWEGSGDGYYLLTAMNPNNASDFSYDHRIVYNIKPYTGEIPTDIIKFDVPYAGQLSNVVTQNETPLYATDWKIKGDLNGTDILTLREMAGRDKNGIETEGILTSIDLSEANIVDGGDCYFYIEDQTYYQTQNGTKRNRFPDQAFMSTNLQEVKLPNSIDCIGKYAFAFCRNLNSVEFGLNTTKIDFSAFNYAGLVNLVIPQQIKEVGPYAFCNMNTLEQVEIGANVSTIGYRAFEKDDNIKEIRCLIETPYDIRDDVFSDDCYKKATLFVPYGKSNLYKAKKGWNNFAKIVEMNEMGIESKATISKNTQILFSNNQLYISGIIKDGIVRVYDLSGKLLISKRCKANETVVLKIPYQNMAIVEIDGKKFNIQSTNK